MPHVPRICCMLALLPAATLGQGSVKSPDGAIELSFSTDGGQLAYSVTYHGKPIVVNSSLALEFAANSAEPLGSHVRIAETTSGSVDETYSMPHGKSNPIRNVCKTLSVAVEEMAPPRRKFAIEARAYDDGIAFRYVIPTQSSLPAFDLLKEDTQFRLAADATTYPILLDGFRTPYEDAYLTMPLSGIHDSSLIGLPLLAEIPGVAWLAITEANIDNYAGMYLRHNSKDARLLTAELSPQVQAPVPGGTPS